MAKQGTNELRLEVEVPTAGLPNLVPNPSGDKGAWGWITPVNNTSLVDFDSIDGAFLNFTTEAAQAAYWTTEFMPVAAGKYVRGQFETVGGTSLTGYGVKVRFEFYDSSFGLLSSSTQTAQFDITPQVNYTASHLAPASTAWFKMRFDFYNGSGGNPAAFTSYNIRKAMATYQDTNASPSEVKTNLIWDSGMNTENGVFDWLDNSGLVTRSQSTNFGRTSMRIESEGYSGRIDVQYQIPMDVTGGKDYVFQGLFRNGLSPVRDFRLAITWLKSNYNTISTTLGTIRTTDDTDWAVEGMVATAPSNAAFALVEVRFLNTEDGDVFYMDDMMFIQDSDKDYPFFNGDTTDTSEYDFAWTGTAYASESTKTSLGDVFEYSDPNDWQNILGPTHSISIKRDSLNVGTLSASIVDALLDPAVADTIRPGRKVRLLSLVHEAVSGTATNYASGITATASAGTLTNASYVTDGDTTAANNATAGDGYVQVDLGEVQVIDTVKVWHYYTDARSYHGTKTEVSDNGYTWHTLYDSGISGEYVETAAGKEYTFAPRRVRYIRDHLAGNTVNTENNWVEIQAWGSTYDEIFENVYEGTLSNAKTTYDKEKTVNGDVTVRIEITANDNIATLANHQKVNGVGSIADLPGVLEGAGTPWNVNGSGEQVASYTTAWKNPNQSALDVVSIVRDSSLGYAWVDRYNVINVWDNDELPTTAVVTFSDAFVADDTYVSYSDIEVDFDTDDCINQVMVQWLDYDTNTGNTEEITYGPYVDAASVTTWGARQAEFTLAAGSYSEATIAAYATAILTANATPAIRCRQLTMPVTTDLERKWATQLDLYSPVAVKYDTILDTTLRVTGIEHNIVATSALGVPTWTVTYTFARQGTVAAPTWTPSPPYTGTTSSTAIFNNIHVKSTADANYSAGNNPALKVGDADGVHLRIDNNEVIAMTDDDSSGTLYVNREARTVIGDQTGGEAKIGPSGSIVSRGILYGNGSYSINGSGEMTITHNAGGTGYNFVITATSHYGTPTVCTIVTKNNNNVVVQVNRVDTGALITSQTRSFNWLLIG